MNTIVINDRGTNKLLWFLGLALCIALALAVSMKAGKDEKSTVYFDREPYINPKVLQDMTASLSDTGDQVIAVDILRSQNSNRYFCQTKTRKTERTSPFIYYEEGQERFGYRYIGKTSSGIDIIQTTSSGSGSGIFHTLVFMVIESGKYLSFDQERSIADFTADRLILEKLGSISLGDRFDGDVRIDGESLYIRQGKGGHSGNTVEEKIIFIKRGN